jgi:hypothetical protein
MEAELIRSGINYISIAHYPEVYQIKNTQLLYRSLIGLGFAAQMKISSIIEVDKNDFVSKIRISEKQKLKKAEKKFLFRQLPVSDLSRVYTFIESCRQDRNQKLSMSLYQVRKTINKFGSDFFLFVVDNEEGLAAAAIVIRINSKILYTFYYAHDKEFDKISPVVYLLSVIYTFAQKGKYQWIDLGTSMSGNEINKPLLHFKESVGGKPSVKYLFEKKYS